MNKKISAKPQPDGDGLQVTYESGDSRRLHRFPRSDTKLEKPPHGAGSFHDPEHHRNLMDRLDAMIRAESKPR